MDNPLFQQACSIQGKLTSKTDDFGTRCNAVLFDAMQAAQRQVADSDGSWTPQLVSSGTGTGKTTFCVGLISAFVAAHSDYSAAYVVATIDEAQRVFDQLAKLLPADALYIHTSAHEAEDTARQHGPEILQHVEAWGISKRSDLAKRRVVVCTHELWMMEADRTADFGVRLYNEKPRSNVILDEFPDTITMLEVGPADFDELADELHRVSDYRHLTAVVRTVATAFRARCNEANARFNTANLLSDDQHAALSYVDLAQLVDARDTNTMRRAWEAIAALRTGRCFLSRCKSRRADQADGHMTLVAYNDRFQCNPGLVILDATADCAPQVQSGQDFHHHSGPNVSYRNLAMTHIQEPAEFKTIASRRAFAETIQSYVQWIKSTVNANTNKQDNTLIVVPKKVAKQLDSQNPIPSRSVMVATWGMGVGSNTYRNCDTVFLFSEFHKPRHAYLAQSLASRNKTATQNDLKSANGAQCTGHVDAVNKAHRIRQFKQMACRGRIRQLDGHGTASSMRLFTSMDRSLFLGALAQLFPDAPHPEFIDTGPQAQATGPKRLATLLTQTVRAKKPITLTAGEVATKAGIESKALKRTFHSGQCKPLHCFGWDFISGQGRKSKPSLRFDPAKSLVGRFRCQTA